MYEQDVDAQEMGHSLNIGLHHGVHSRGAHLQGEE